MHIDSRPPKRPGNSPTTEQAQNNRNHVTTAGTPPYVIGAKVSHQQVEAKKITPNIHPAKNDLAKESFSLQIATKRGISAKYARNQNSKSGKASARSTAEDPARAILPQDGTTF
jgi:hypothetical protein